MQFPGDGRRVPARGQASRRGGWLRSALHHARRRQGRQV